MAEDAEDGELHELSRISAIRLSQLNAFYAEHGTKKPCSICGKTNWVVVGSEFQPAPIKLSAYDRGEAFGLVFMLTCSTCGDARFTNAANVLSWIEAEENNERQ
ncbi:hypothetical protein ACIQUS_25695 [Pseudomonas sp. NPDC090755]|uniref:hypothetical protein n=1 Tax=Pseudomonas sp. NPDC090755 TaxID=3364481 RepID=UPI00383ADDE0